MRIVHDLVNHHLVAKGEDVGGPKRRLRGIQPSARRLWETAAQPIAHGHGVQQGALTRSVKKQFVARVRTEAELRLGEDQEPAHLDRVTRRDNITRRRRSGTAQLKAVQGHGSGAVIHQLNLELRIQAAPDFVKGNAWAQCRISAKGEFGAENDSAMSGFSTVNLRG